jgi:hypothetical protein
MNSSPRRWNARAFVACLCSSAQTLAFAVVTAGTAAAAVSNGGNVTSSSTLESGFYRNVDHPTVYRVLNGKICAVLSEAHLKALGATHKTVHVVSDSVDFLNGKRFDPACPWPDGYYHRHGDDFIMKVNDGTACLLTSTDENVLEVASDDQVMAGKKFTGRCKS